LLFLRTDDAMSSPSSRPPPAIAPEPMIGKQLAGRYRLERLLGRGGMGAVYEAVNHLGKRFAVKLILAEGADASPEAKKRFVREARASSEIVSQHVVGVVDADTDAATGAPFIVMDLMTGSDLGALVTRVGPVDPKTAVRLALQSCRGLRAAHARAIVHRDIKPANIFLDARENGEVVAKICDFGIAKTLGTEAMDQSSGGLTKTGGMLGSPVYMSPEQARNAKNVDVRTDVWSLCVTLHEVLSGAHPWQHCSTIGELILGICTEDFRPLGSIAPWLDPKLVAVVQRGLRRDLRERWQTIDELAEALRPFAEGSEQVTQSMLVGVSGDVRSSAVSHPSDAIDASAPTLAASDGPSARTLGLASTMRPNAASVAMPPAKRRGTVGVAIAVGIVAVGAAGGWFFFRKDAARDVRTTTMQAASAATSPASVASTEFAAPPAAAASTSASGAPSAKIAKLVVSPPTAKVTVDGAPRDLVDGSLSLPGEPGESFVVVATVGTSRTEKTVVLLKGGLVAPDRIVVSTGSTSTNVPTASPSVKKPPPAALSSIAAPAPSPSGPTLKSSWP
jgi:serine/threonine-protein kinase